ncbi:MAG: cation transporting ATPase C-terminal domain-containing protein [Clostridia bacterium]
MLLPALALAFDPAEFRCHGKKTVKTRNKVVFTKGMTWRIIYQGMMIGLINISSLHDRISYTNTDLPVMECSSQKK